MFTSPGDTALRIFDFPLYWYGVVMAVSCFVGVVVSYLIFRQTNKKNAAEKIWDCSLWVLIFGILGARLYYCLLNPVYYFSNPWDILNFREGGLSVHGAIIAGVLTTWIISKKNGLNILKLLDAYACGISIAQSIGRWGNFFNSEAFGLPTQLPWKLYIPYSHRPEGYLQFDYFHPTFLYESIADFFVFVLLLFMMKKFAIRYSGLTFFAYLVLYSIVRIFVESLRLDSALDIGGIAIAKIVSTLMLVAGLIGIIFIINFKKQISK